MALVVGFALSGCTNSGEPLATSASDAPPTTPAVAAVEGGSLDALLAQSFDSFMALRDASTAVVILSPRSSLTRPVVGGDGLSIPETITTGTVDDCVWGDCPQSLAIVQLGDTSMDTQDSGKLLEQGGRYLLFVRPATNRNGEHVLTGTVTSYRWDGETYVRAHEPDAGSPKLPAVVTPEDLRALAG